MADQNYLKQHPERVSVAMLKGANVTWAIIGGGFLLGILCGALFLFGAPDSPREPAPLAAAVPQPAPAVPVGKPVASSPMADEQATDLAAERERLQRELEAEQLRREVESLRRELVHLKTSPVSSEPARPVSRTRSTSPQEPVKRGPSPGAATLTYWNRLNAIILQEAALRSAPQGGVTAGNAAGFLDARIQAAQFAVNAIEQLDATDVDARVVKVGDQLIGWYGDAREVSETGRQLLTRASVQERQGSAGKGYQAAERRHAKDVNEINSFGEQVRQEMSRKYGINFPPLN